MTSRGCEAVRVLPLPWWSLFCFCSWWLCVQLSDVRAARSLSVLDSRLVSFYQRPYDVFEPGFVADPAGYEARNAFQSRHSDETTTAKNTFKSAPEYPHDGGYHTKTVPVYPNPKYQHSAGGYATQNAFHQPHYSTGKDKYPDDGGYHTKTVGFPMYQDYQHPYDAEPVGYATRNAFHPYREGEKQTKDAGKYLTDDGYHTKTAESKWLPVYQDLHDPGGYATQNAFQPYRSGDAVSGSHDYKRGSHKRRKSVAHNDNSRYKLRDEDRVVYRHFYSDDDGDDEDDWSTKRAAASSAASTDYSNRFVHKPGAVSTEGWRSAVGGPHIHLPASRAVSTSAPASAGPRHSTKLDITIDRFGQEEDVTGASFNEPIGYMVDGVRQRSLHQMPRSLSKQSDTAQLINSFVKYSPQQTAGNRPHKYDPCMSLPDGDYPLDHRFHSLLPGINSRCNFIKCAHRSTFVNPCSEGTRNPNHDLNVDVTDPRTTGAHYCSVRDVDNYCHQQYHHRRSDDDDDDDVKNADYDVQQLNELNVKHYYIA